MQKVVEAMCGALSADQAELMRMLRGVADKVPFTAPEAMRDRWVELCAVFNRAVLGTADEALWDRAKAPAWSLRAGRILAGEVAV
jgi:hypothetical protein